MSKYKEIVFFDNYYDRNRYEEARDYLFETNEKYKTKEDISEEDIQQEIAFTEEINWNDFESEFTRLMDGDSFLMTGTIGRWNGNFEGGTFIHSFKDLHKAWDDCDYIKVYEKAGHLYITCSHHDGTNHFELKKVSEKGMHFYKNSYLLSDKEAHQKMWNNNFMTSLPHFGKKLGYAKAI